MSSAEPPTAGADPVPGKAVVLYDGMCPFCRRSVWLLKRLDWFKRLRYQDCRDTAHWPPCAEPLSLTRLLTEMHVVPAARRRALAGYRAIRWLAWRLPLLWPVAPLMYVPGAPWLGNKLYLWIAKHRYDLIPCEDGGCRVPRSGTRPEDREQRTENRDQRAKKTG
jgi:predicted DCC family thiol-disulfide oxidoreductase YuxK